jgi:enoyl-CoA hydratase/carnithine racemase
MDHPPFKRTTMARVGRTAVLALASDKVNALDVEVLREITSFVEYCEQDPEVGALVLTGEGPLFSAGLNVNEVLAHDPDYAGVLLGALSDALLGVFRCPLPTVVAVNGPAIAGGCLLACVFDKRLIAEDARIGVTELQVGVSFPVFAVELLRHVCGPGAERVMLDAELLDAATACREGLAHRAVPRSELQAAAMAEAERLASLDPRAYALAKTASRRFVLSAIGAEGGPALDEQVRDHWGEDRTRANLGRLVKPKG